MWYIFNAFAANSIFLFSKNSFLLFLLYLEQCLKLFLISAPLNNLPTFERPLRQKVKTHVFDIHLNNVISNSVAFYGMNEAGVL